VLRGRGHRRDQQQRVVHRHLHAATQRGVGIAAVDVVHADHVGQEQAVEQRRLQRAGQVRPVAQLVEAGRLVTRMGPQPLLDVADAIHVEGIEQDLAGHGGRVG
jgi:hypothetical protein